jgi:hypothetical protein
VAHSNAGHLSFVFTFVPCESVLAVLRVVRAFGIPLALVAQRKGGICIP